MTLVSLVLLRGSFVRNSLDGQVHIPHARSGWVAGQHIRLRIFFLGRVFESHPFTIFSATPDLSCITSMPSGLSLGSQGLR
jgi:ferric-chelate reductase